MSRPVQYFTKEYLEQCKAMSPTQIAQFLEDFRTMHGVKSAPTRLISIKVPENLLAAFKTKASLSGMAYQTQIKKLMTEWLGAT
jgi:predicted DNA binding CopG/RHH family protein